MIAPRSRLLFWVAAIVLPFALIAAVAPASAGLAGLFIAAFLGLAAVDAVTATRALAGAALELPAMIRMSKGREIQVDLRLRPGRSRQRHWRVALAWPPAIKARDEIIDTLLPAASDWSRLPLVITPRQRGCFNLNSAVIETASPLGFWAVRRAFPLQSEIRVYPNLLTERKNLATLFLNRGAFGMHAHRQVGQGRDFEKLRDYLPGDSYDEIHWKATARHGRPVTKVFQIEKTQEIYVILDASRLSARQPGPDAPPDTSALERFITAALVLGLAAEQQGDLFGLLTFTDRVDTFLRAKGGQLHYRACRDRLYTLQPKIVTPDFDELCAFLRLRLRRRALLVFLTALDDPALAESFVRNADLLRRQHIVLVNQLRPPAIQPLFAGPDVTEMDDLYQRLGGHLQWRKLCELQKVLQRRAVRLSLLDDERLSATLVSQYLNVKKRQLL